MKYGAIFAIPLLFSVPDLLAQSARPGMGATPYADTLGTGVTFRVWAPNATNVQLIGDFNSWVPGNNLTKEGTTGVWSVDVPNAAAGQQYKFFLNGSLYRKDPRSRAQVSSTGNSIIYDPDAFAWPTNAFTPPSISNLVVYELHVGTFEDPNPSDATPGRLQDAIARLDHLTNLGVNCVELMPVHEFPLDHSWGYNPSDPYSVESTYGGPDAMKQFVAACHQRGIAVLLDVVHNHYGSGDLDLWEFDGPANPYFYPASTGACCTIWGPRPNYGQPRVREYIKEHFVQWLDEYRVDGFRNDSPMNIANWNVTNPIPDGASLINEVNGLIRSNYPGRFSIGEDANLFASFDAEWHVSFHDRIVAELATNEAARDLGAIAYHVTDAPGFRRVLYTENHDKVGTLNGGQRVPHKMNPSDPTSVDAQKLAMLGAVLTLTSPGIPLLFMGQEYHEELPFGDTDPLDWNKAGARFRATLFYRDLVRMRRGLDAGTAGLRGANVDAYHINDGANVMAYHRWINAGNTNDDTVVVLNLSTNQWSSYNMDFPYGGRWYVHLNSDWVLYGTNFSNYGYASVVATGGTPSADLRLAPHSALILSRAAPPPRDADGDAMPDTWEQQFGLNWTNASDAAANLDGDLYNNLQEYERGTRPDVFEYFTRFTNMTAAGTFNNWDAAAGNMKKLTDYTWQYIVRQDTAPDLQFKFAAHGTWSVSWGRPLGDVDTVFPLYGSVESNSAYNLFALQTPGGVWRFTFNETNLAYSLDGMEWQDSDGDGMHDAWESFHELDPQSAADAAANPDGDGYSNLDEFNFSRDPHRVEPKSSAYTSMTAAGTFNGWDAASSNMALVADHLWQGVLNFGNPTNIAFKFAAGSWSNNWGENSISAATPPLGGMAESYGNDVTAAIHLAGSYRFRFNDTSLAYAVEPVYTSSLRALALVGNFNGWAPSVNNMALVSNGVWQLQTVYGGETNVEFKFAANSGWTTNWGADGQTKHNPDLAGTGTPFGANIRLDGPLRGTHLFRFIESNASYHVFFTPKSSVSNLFVAGTFNGWNSSGMAMRLVDDYRWEATTNFNLASNVQFKFNANGTWDVNWGDTNQTSQVVPIQDAAEYGGPNIVAGGVLHGPYRIRFHDFYNTYEFARMDVVDSDGDGMPDFWERQYGYATNSAADGQADSDNDGASNSEEFLADTSPTDPSSVLELHMTRATNVSWIGGLSSTQYLEWASQLAGPWTCILTSAPPTALTNRATLGVTNTARYYRLRAAPSL